MNTLIADLSVEDVMIILAIVFALLFGLSHGLKMGSRRS